MFSDVLKRELYNGILLNCKNDRSFEGFYETLKRIAKQDIIECGTKVDSDKAIKIYREILKNNLDYLPEYTKEVYECNGQYKFEVSVRNIFSSNAYHSTGLANDSDLRAYKISKPSTGRKIVFKKA